MNVKCDNLNNCSFHYLLDKNLKNFSDNSILFQNECSYSWKDIEIASQIVAYDLHKLGATEKSNIGIICKTTINWVVVYLAIQKIGANSVLLNNQLTYYEIIEFSKIVEFDILCYGDVSFNKNKDTNIYQKLLDNSSIKHTYDIRKNIDFRDRIEEYKQIKDLFSTFYSPRNLFTILFSSGSTGKPTYSVHSTRELLHFAQTSVNQLLITSKDKICCYLPFFHFLGLITSIPLMLIKQSVLCLADDAYAESIVGTIYKHKCTIFSTVPTMLHNIFNIKSLDINKLESIRCTIYGGGSISKTFISELYDKMPNNSFVSNYGNTDVGQVSLGVLNDTKEHVIETVGKPDNRHDIKIVYPDTTDECDFDEIGEILIRSEVKDFPDTNKFKNVIIIDNKKWRRTFDLGFINKDGYLTVKGRKDSVINRGGEIIFPSEIENELCKIDYINNAVVFGVNSKRYGEEIAAAIECIDSEKFSKEAVNCILQNKLAKYKIPVYYEVFEKLPLLSNSKIDLLNIKEICLSNLKSSVTNN